MSCHQYEISPKQELETKCPICDKPKYPDIDCPWCESIFIDEGK